MKKLKKISLSNVKVMDAQEMKMVLGGQFVQDTTCRVAGGSGGFFDGTGSNNEEPECTGICGSELDPGTGTMERKTCTLGQMKGVNGEVRYFCECL